LIHASATRQGYGRNGHGHHHPDYFADAAEAIGRKPNRNQALVVSLAGAAARREKAK
jgi:hypothetical protein